MYCSNINTANQFFNQFDNGFNNLLYKYYTVYINPFLAIIIFVFKNQALFLFFKSQIYC